MEPHSEGHYAIHLRRDSIASARLQWILRLHVTQQQDVLKVAVTLPQKRSEPSLVVGS